MKYFDYGHDKETATTNTIKKSTRILNVSNIGKKTKQLRTRSRLSPAVVIWCKYECIINTSGFDDMEVSTAYFLGFVQ